MYVHSHQHHDHHRHHQPQQQQQQHYHRSAIEMNVQHSMMGILYYTSIFVMMIMLSKQNILK